MRHVNYALKPATIDNARPRDKAYALTDGGGLQREVLPSGSKTWRFKYHLNGKREKVTIGAYLAFTIKQARDRREELRALVERGQSPAKSKRALSTEQKLADARRLSLLMKATDDPIRSYYDWLKAKTAWREVNGWGKITTPYLDRHNDYIQIHLRQQGQEWMLTNDGYTLAHLAQSGCEIDMPRRKALLAATLNGFGVQQNADSLEIKATEDNFPLRKHSLLQAILAVNDLFYVACANVESFFFEYVALWLDDADVRYTPRVNFVGHSRYNYQFDFVVPKSKRAPERILCAINNTNKDSAQSAAFAWVDTKDIRQADSLAFAILNDRDHKVSEAVQDALRSYDITPIGWTTREEFRERLAA